MEPARRFRSLISVGQQAYVGIGAYGLWLLGDVLHINPFVAVILAGFLAVVIAVPVAPLLFRLRRRLLRDRHVGDRRGDEVDRLEHPVDRRRFRQDRHIGRARHHRPWLRGVYWLALGAAVASILVVFFLLRSRLGLALTSIRDNDVAAQSSG